MKKKKIKEKYRIIYICKKCKAEIAHGAIICPYCRQEDPKIEAIGVIPS